VPGLGPGPFQLAQHTRTATSCVQWDFLPRTSPGGVGRGWCASQPSIATTNAWDDQHIKRKDWLKERLITALEVLLMTKQPPYLEPVVRQHITAKLFGRVKPLLIIMEQKGEEEGLGSYHSLQGPVPSDWKISPRPQPLKVHHLATLRTRHQHMDHWGITRCKLEAADLPTESRQGWCLFPAATVSSALCLSCTHPNYSSFNQICAWRWVRGKLLRKLSTWADREARKGRQVGKQVKVLLEISLGKMREELKPSLLSLS
jgi:hypothetical protein